MECPVPLVCWLYIISSQCQGSQTVVYFLLYERHSLDLNRYNKIDFAYMDRLRLGVLQTG